jgi:hypothetical protein
MKIGVLWYMRRSESCLTDYTASHLGRRNLHSHRLESLKSHRVEHILLKENLYEVPYIYIHIYVY